MLHPSLRLPLGRTPRKRSCYILYLACLMCRWLGSLWSVRTLFMLLKWLPPHSADPLPEFQFRDCGFVVSGTRFQKILLRSVGISIFPALELPDFKISSFGASRFQYFRLRSVAISIFPASEQHPSKEIVCNSEAKIEIVYIF